MPQWSRELENRYLLRAGCAPLVVLSFVGVAAYWSRWWLSLSLLDHPVARLLLLAICTGVGLRYLLMIPGRPAERVALVVVYIPVMTFILLCYSVLFGMCVLGIYL